MTKNKKGIKITSGFDNLSPFGQNNGLNLRMMIESNQTSSEVGGFQKTMRLCTKGKGPKVKSRRDI